MLVNNSQNGISSFGKFPMLWDPAYFRYIFPHTAKFIGVVKMHAAVLKAVSDTDSSEFPREREVMKLETLPPGHEATRIMPNATIGEMRLPHAMIRRNVNAGRSMIWHTIPVMIDFGFLTISTKFEGFMPRATPNITNPSATFRRCCPSCPPTDTLRVSRTSIPTT